MLGVANQFKMLVNKVYDVGYVLDKQTTKIFCTVVITGNTVVVFQLLFRFDARHVFPKISSCE